jgi:hypothetical protein
MLDAFTTEVLKLVNDVREAVGLPALQELPKGGMKQSLGCPLSQALGPEGERVSVGINSITAPSREFAEAAARVWHTSWRCEEGTYIVYLPQTLREFVFIFDQGELPELITD